MTTEDKKIFVFLACGDQGKSVCKYLLKAGFEVHGLTREPESDEAKEIEKLGVKLCKADMEDPSSYSHYLEGMYGAFINADFWESYFSSGLDVDLAARTEQKHATAAVDACANAKVKHIVYSTLGDHDGTIHPGVSYPHHDNKAAVSKHIRDIGIPCTHILTSTYISNIVKFNFLEQKHDGSGTWTLTIPAMDDCILPSFAVEQWGAWVTTAFLNPEKWKNMNMVSCSELITVGDTAKVLSEVSGKKVDTLQLTKEQFESDELKKKVTPEVWIQYKQFAEGHCPRDVEASREIVPDQWDTRAWARQSSELRKLMKF